MAEIAGFGVYFGQMPLDPQHGGAGHGACHGAVGGDGKQLFGADGLAENLRLLGAAPVGVDDGVYQ